MADFKSERFRGAQLLGNWILWLGYGCFFITACLIVILLAVIGNGNGLVSFLTFIVAVGGIFAMVIAGMFFLWASFALRIMVAIEHNTHSSG
jgi:hypothetical protein